MTKCATILWLASAWAVWGQTPYAFTNFAGSAGQGGYADGPADSARFNHPCGVVVDGAGNVYVADTQNHVIRKVSAGEVTTLAGRAGLHGRADGAGKNARFFFPRGLAVDVADNLYVADSSNHTIRKISPSGRVTTLAGRAGMSGCTDGMGSAARFALPYGVAADSSGCLFVADTGNHTIRKLTPNGAVSTVAGRGGTSGSADGQGSTARFNHPCGIAVDAAGNVYVADTQNHILRKVTAQGRVTTLAGKAGTAGGADGLGSDARFNRPSGLAVDGAGNVFVVDTYNHTIRRLEVEGRVATVAGNGLGGSADGPGPTAQFFWPMAVAVDEAGRLLVADTDNDHITQGTPAPTKPLGR